MGKEKNYSVLSIDREDLPLCGFSADVTDEQMEQLTSDVCDALEPAYWAALENACRKNRIKTLDEAAAETDRKARANAIREEIAALNKQLAQINDGGAYVEEDQIIEDEPTTDEQPKEEVAAAKPGRDAKGRFVKRTVVEEPGKEPVVKEEERELSEEEAKKQLAAALDEAYKPLIDFLRFVFR